eukprot:SM000024S07807  [mRNA]  locus=s24:642022:643937:+ [translate_table: standard]
MAAITSALPLRCAFLSAALSSSSSVLHDGAAPGPLIVHLSSQPRGAKSRAPVAPGAMLVSPWLGDRVAQDGASSKTSGQAATKRVRAARRKRWVMEVLDPLSNYRDSFGNECLLEKNARQVLETTESYRNLLQEVNDMRDRLRIFVAKEQYAEAAEIRDALNVLQFRKRVLELSVKPQVTFRVGDVIIHRRYGYRGVVYGHDPECSAPQEWQEAMKIDALPKGPNQPFYHILVDTRDRPGGMSTYVAQENIVIQKTNRPVMHPWITRFFVGLQDGTYVPGSKLRQVYPDDW